MPMFDHTSMPYSPEMEAWSCPSHERIIAAPAHQGPCPHCTPWVRGRSHPNHATGVGNLSGVETPQFVAKQNSWNWPRSIRGHA
jgi:hypothetical protein